MPEYEEVYIVFDGPPGLESPRFVEVEVETLAGQSVRVEWHQDILERKGYYRLGPLYQEAQDAN